MDAIVWIPYARVDLKKKLKFTVSFTLFAFVLCVDDTPGLI